ncbi:MAG: von Willebrand factor type A domain-containing protein, partial [Bradymonadia bacterium]
MRQQNAPRLMGRVTRITAVVGAVLCLAFGLGYADGGTKDGAIRGQITANGKALAGVSIKVSGPTNTSATTGADGRYSVQVKPGTYTVKAVKQGYRATKRSGVKVSAGQVTTVSFKMRSNAPKPSADPSPVAASTPPPKEMEARGNGKSRRRTRRGRVGLGGLGTRGMGVGGGGSGSGYGRGIKVKRKAAKGVARAYRRPSRPAPRRPLGNRSGLITADAGGDMNREAYDKITDNPFKATSVDALSTFSIDVDTASYANMRRFLDRSQMPPKDAVRIEEMVNYFSYDYADPKGEDPF